MYYNLFDDGKVVFVSALIIFLTLFNIIKDAINIARIKQNY